MGLFSGISLSSIVSQGIAQGIQNASTPSDGVYPNGTAQIGSNNKVQQIATNMNVTGKNVTELSSLTIPPTGYSILKYPTELQGNSLENPPHSVMFYVNKPAPLDYVVANNNDQPNFVINSQLNSPGSLGFSVEGLEKLATNGVVPLLQPQQKRILQAIALYMPDTVISGFQHNWDAVSLTDEMGNLGRVAGVISGLAGVYDDFKSALGDVSKVSAHDFKPLQTAAEKIITAAGNSPGLLEDAAIPFGGNWGAIVTGAKGYAINPQLEMIYRGTAQRSFIFEFRFQPRSKAETAQVNAIIKAFKQYSSPSLINGIESAGGRYFVTPCSFDIKFLFTNQENLNLPKISTCVLEDMQINYSDAGQFNTYADGMPVSIGLQLRFKEMDIIYSSLIQNSGY